jgi:hypothetical protein
MNIGASIYLLLGFAGLIQCAVLYLVINFATKADRRAKYEWAQMDLLGKIALRQGVSAGEITKTYQAAGLMNN